MSEENTMQILSKIDLLELNTRREISTNHKKNSELIAVKEQLLNAHEEILKRDRLILSFQKRDIEAATTEFTKNHTDYLSNLTEQYNLPANWSYNSDTGQIIEEVKDSK